jgi:ERCC4-type nuclease
MPKVSFSTKTKKTITKSTAKTKKDSSISTTTPSANEFIIVIDQQEKHQFTFPREIKTIKKHLRTADYSLVGFEDRICIERKSKSDAWGSVSEGRDRFRREYERMAKFEKKIVVIESTLEDFLIPPIRMVAGQVIQSRVDPKTPINTFISWFERYNVPFIFVDNHEKGMAFTLRFLSFFYQHEMERIKEREVKNVS